MGWVIFHPPYRDFWEGLPEQSPIRVFANTLYLAWDDDDAYTFIENTYDKLADAQTLDDVSGFGSLDWGITAKLLQSGMTLPPELFGCLLEQILDEAFRIGKFDALGVKPKRRGRPTDRARLGMQIRLVSSLIRKDGMSKSQAYKRAASELHKSPDTIRRNYERALKRQRDRGK